jgi:hypothetical protein
MNSEELCGDKQEPRDKILKRDRIEIPEQAYRTLDVLIDE